MAYAASILRPVNGGSMEIKRLLLKIASRKGDSLLTIRSQKKGSDQNSGSDVDWRLIFELSPMNGGHYTGDELIPMVFKPVTDSWFQKRLAHVRAELKKEMLEETGRSPKDRHGSTDWNDLRLKRDN
jgi:hypothetical protein